jgi:transposase
MVYTKPMASLQRHRVKGHTYWRIVESKRINGKPRAIPVMHLGTADQLLERLLNAPQGQLRVQSFQHGDVATLKAIADKLDIVRIIDAHAGRSRRKHSVGTSMLLAAINRAVRPRSKRGWADWAGGTSLHRLFGIEPRVFTSQHFWDQMDVVSEQALEKIEDEITREVVERFDIELDTLFYDTTNFFTYISSTNDRSRLAQRGKSKQRRMDLRQFSLALLVSREGQVPLCSHVYEGNTVDVTVFSQTLTKVRQRLEALVGEVEDLTVVYDKGNNSRDNQARVDSMPFHYVASLVPSHYPDLVQIPSKRYKPLRGGRLKGLAVLRSEKELWGERRTLVQLISPQLRSGQIRGLDQHLSKRLRELEKWKQTLEKPRSGPRNADNARKRIASLLEGQYVSQVLSIKYDPRRKSGDRLSWSIDEQVIKHLHNEVFGKRILMTDRHDWSSEEIILAYRGQSLAEESFRQLKDPEHLAVRPQYHWTDQKVRVHTFTCLLALILCRLVEREARGHGYTGDLDGLLDRLGRVRLAMVLHSSGKKGGRPRCDWMLEKTDKDNLSLFRRLVPPHEPFVYTPSAP